MSTLPLRPGLEGEEPYGAPELDVPVRLNVNENPYAPSPAVVESIARAAAGAAGRLNRYPDRDFPALRRALADYLAVESGVRPDWEGVWAANGSNEVMLHVLQAFGGPGRTCLSFTPTYSMYPEYARDTLTDYATRPRRKDFTLDTDAAVAAIKELRPAVVILASPNNPTGSILDEESLDAAAFVAREHGVYIICDDVYRKLVYEAGYEGFAVRHPGLRDRVVVVDSFSKPYAMTGWRLGWLAAAAPIVAKLSMVHQFAVSSVPSFIQHAALEALSYDTAAFMEAYRRRRGLVVDALRTMGLDLVEPQGAFYAFPSIRPLGLTSEEFCERAIEEAGVALVPGSLFGGEGHVRLSYACDDETLNEGLIRLASFIRALKARS